MRTIKDKVKRLCKMHDITIQQLEKELKIGNGTIGRWDKYNPRMENLEAVADYFCVPVSYLLESEMPEQEENPTPETASDALIAIGTYEVDLLTRFRQLSDIGKMKILLTVMQELNAEQAKVEEKDVSSSTSAAG